MLLFDEATSSLDAETERQIIAELRRLASGRTVIMVAHRLAPLAVADAILVMRNGEIDAFGPREELLRISPIFQGLVRGTGLATS